MKLVRSKVQLAANPHMGWVHSVPEDRIKFPGRRGGTRRGGADGHRHRWIRCLAVAESFETIGRDPAVALVLVFI